MQTSDIGSLSIPSQCITETYPAESMYLQPFYTTEKLLPNLHRYLHRYVNRSKWCKNICKKFCKKICKNFCKRICKKFCKMCKKLCKFLQKFCTFQIYTAFSDHVKILLVNFTLHFQKC